MCAQLGLEHDGTLRQKIAIICAELEVEVGWSEGPAGGASGPLLASAEESPTEPLAPSPGLSARKAARRSDFLKSALQEGGLLCGEKFIGRAPQLLDIT